VSVHDSDGRLAWVGKPTGQLTRFPKPQVIHGSMSRKGNFGRVGGQKHMNFISTAA
jgi:hypothetical protein